MPRSKEIGSTSYEVKLFELQLPPSFKMHYWNAPQVYSRDGLYLGRDLAEVPSGIQWKYLLAVALVPVPLTVNYYAPDMSLFVYLGVSVTLALSIHFGLY